MASSCQPARSIVPSPANLSMLCARMWDASWRVHDWARRSTDRRAVCDVRAWERRYGLVAPVRTEGGYRLYDEQGLQLLRAMGALVAGRVVAEPGGRAPALRRSPPDSDRRPPTPACGRPDSVGRRRGR